jgi:hypothetical protein
MPEKIQFTSAAERPDSFSHRDSLRFSRKNQIFSEGDETGTDLNGLARIGTIR